DTGAGSLRQAVQDANSAAGADVISFNAGLTGTLTLTSGQLHITDDLTIQGPGANALTISGNDASRIFLTDFDIDVDISGLTLTHGFGAPSPGSDGYGGAILNDATLKLSNVTLTGNRADYGAGLWNSGFSTATLTNCTLTGNSAAAAGGGF